LKAIFSEMVDAMERHGHLSIGSQEPSAESQCGYDWPVA